MYIYIYSHILIYTCTIGGFALALGALAPAVLGAEDDDQQEAEKEIVVDEVTGEVSGGGGGG